MLEYGCETVVRLEARNEACVGCERGSVGSGKVKQESGEGEGYSGGARKEG